MFAIFFRCVYVLRISSLITFTASFYSGDKVNKVKPTLVLALEHIVLQQITCGWSHSVALTSEGEVYVSVFILSLSIAMRPVSCVHLHLDMGQWRSWQIRPRQWQKGINSSTGRKAGWSKSCMRCFLQRAYCCISRAKYCIVRWRITSSCSRCYDSCQCWIFT